MNEILYNSKFCYNKTFGFFQFDVYELNFGLMKQIIEEIKTLFILDYNLEIQEQECQFKINQHSQTNKNKFYLQIPITEIAYSILKNVKPEMEVIVMD